MPAQTYLGFDFGWRRLGIAVGESVTGSARPIATLRCRQGQPDWGALLDLIAAWHPTALVVGIPRHADGSASKSTLQALAFTQRLRQSCGLPVHQVDERLSSHEARARLQATGQRNRASTDKALVDRLAAQVILETWLSEHKP